MRQISRLSAKTEKALIQYSFLVSCLTACVCFYPRWGALEKKTGVVLGVLPLGRFWGERQLRTTWDQSRVLPQRLSWLRSTEDPYALAPGIVPQGTAFYVCLSLLKTSKSLSQPNSPCKSHSQAPTQDAKLTLVPHTNITPHSQAPTQDAKLTLVLHTSVTILFNPL